MGPRSVDRGRPGLLEAVTIERCELQWGHDQLIVEGEEGSMESVSDEYRLQWGHDQLIVEGDQLNRVETGA